MQTNQTFSLTSYFNDLSHNLYERDFFGKKEEDNDKRKNTKSHK